MPAVDRVDDSTVVLRLLEDHHQWRGRSVEELQLSLGNHVRAVTRYQCRFPPDLLKDLGIATPCLLRAAIPLGAKPKRDLLRFVLHSSEGSGVYLRERSLIAADEAADLYRVFAGSQASDAFKTALTVDSLTAICAFMPGRYESLLPPARYPEKFRLWRRPQAMQQYLEDGLGITIPRKLVRAWLEAFEATAEILARQLDEPRDYSSSSECPLLALPLLLRRPMSTAEITDFVLAYTHAVRRADAAAADDLESRIALSGLAEYGRRWEMIVETVVPTDSTFELSFEEDRPLGIRRNGWVVQTVTMGDARSSHVVVSVSDPNVAIADYNVVNRAYAGVRPVALGILEDVRRTDEALSLYSSEEDRPYLVDVSVRLRTAGYIRWTAYAAALVTASAVVGVLAASRSRDLIEKLTLLTLPTTVAATFILVREQTALATRLERSARVVLSATLLCLWIALFWRVLREGHLPWVSHSWHAVRERARDLWQSEAQPHHVHQHTTSVISP